MIMRRPRVPARYVVLVTGSREWTDVDAIRRRLTLYPSALVIHGYAHGADMIAEEIAREEGMRTLAEPYFGDLGNEGGAARNELLVHLAMVYDHHGYTVVVEAFPTASSRGTWHCAKLAERYGLKVAVTRG